MVVHSKKINKGMFRKNETIRAAGGKRGLLVVAIRQCQNNGFRSSSSSGYFKL